MNQHLGLISILVDDYDKAIAFYTGKLAFQLIEDTRLTEEKRWVVVRPKGNGTASLLLAKAANAVQKTQIGRQSGGRVFLFLFTDDLERDYNNYTGQGIEIVREPVTQNYGRVFVFADLYGNLWDCIQPANNGLASKQTD